MPYQAPQKRQPQPEDRPPKFFKQQWAYLKHNGTTRRAYHQRYDESGKQSCTFCCIGQVWIREGSRCAYCGAEVIKVAGEGWKPAPELRLTFKARNLKAQTSALAI